MNVLKKQIPLSFLLIILGAFMLAGCGPDETPETISQVDTRVWIDKPVTNTIHPLAPVEIIFHGASGKDISRYQLLIDDAVIEENIPAAYDQAPFDKLDTFLTAWIPSEPGEYTLKIRVQSSGDEWAESLPVQLTIGESIQPFPTGTTTPTITPTPTATATVQPGTVFSEPNVSTELFYYRFSDCADRSPNTVTISVNAYDPAGIVNVELYFRIKHKITYEMSEWQSVVMQPDDNGGYSFTLDADQLPTFVGNKESWLHFQLIANNSEGVITSSPVYFNVTVKGCEP
jgi:hypothetical protein